MVVNQPGESAAWRSPFIVIDEEGLTADTECVPTVLFNDHLTGALLRRDADGFALTAQALYAISDQGRELVASFDKETKSFLSPDGTLLCRWEGERRWRNEAGDEVTNPSIKTSAFTDQLRVTGGGRELKRHHHDFSLYYSSGRLMASFNWLEMIYNLAEIRNEGWHDLRSDEVFVELVVAPPAWAPYRAVTLPEVVAPGARSRPSALAGRLLPVECMRAAPALA